MAPDQGGGGAVPPILNPDGHRVAIYNIQMTGSMDRACDAHSVCMSVAPDQGLILVWASSRLSRADIHARQAEFFEALRASEMIAEMRDRSATA